MRDVSALLPDPTPELDAGPRPESLDEASLEPLLAGLGEADEPELLRACALLWHDRLESAHGLVMRREGDRLADTLHAIIHRRERDEGNSLHWWGRVGRHPLGAELGEEASNLGLGSLTLPDGSLNAQLVARACCRGSADAYALRELQAKELRLLAQTLLGP